MRCWPPIPRRGEIGVENRSLKFAIFGLEKVSSEPAPLLAKEGWILSFSEKDGVVMRAVIVQNAIVFNNNKTEK